jgi:DUF971 family protein
VAAPVAVDVARDEGVTVTWDDGAVASFGLEELRRNCPCAACRELRGAGRPVAGPGPFRVESAETVGAWGLALVWNDGHSTGIYPWDRLRAWSEERGG